MQCAIPIWTFVLTTKNTCMAFILGSSPQIYFKFFLQNSEDEEGCIWTLNNYLAGIHKFQNNRNRKNTLRLEGNTGHYLSLWTGWPLQGWQKDGDQAGNNLMLQKILKRYQIRTGRTKRKREVVIKYRKTFFYLSFNQQSEYKVFYKLMCWLARSPTCRLPNVVRSPPARRSRKFSHYWLMFGSSFTKFL